MQVDKMSLSFPTNYAVVVIQLDILQLQYNAIPKIILRRFRMKKNKFSQQMSGWIWWVSKITPNWTWYLTFFSLQEWEDVNLAWNTSEYGNVEDVRIPPSALWKPDILMYNR